MMSSLTQCLVQTIGGTTEAVLPVGGIGERASNERPSSLLDPELGSDRTTWMMLVEDH